MKKQILTSSILLLLSQSLFSNDNFNKVSQSESDLNLTIYNSNLAMISETRNFDLSKGYQRIIYENVPQQVITESIRPLFSQPITLFSQNYLFDTISFDSMLKESLGKEIKYVEDQSIIKEGILISKNPIMIEIKDTKEVITVTDRSKIIFSKIPSYLSINPSLEWKINSTKESKNSSIKLNYLSRGFDWKSDYIFSLNEDSKNLNLNGWITLTNNSGVNYPNANLTFLAGKVNQEPVFQQRNFAMQKEMVEMDSIAFAASVPEIKNESFSGYHIYKIPFKEDIKNKEKKQISFLDKKNIDYKEYGMFNNQVNFYYQKAPLKMNFDNYIEIENKDSNGLGIPLPEGIVRVYNKDKSGKEHFIGESRIKNTPKNQILEIKTGELFDIKGLKTIKEVENQKNFKKLKTEFLIENNSDYDKIVKIKESVPTFGKVLFFTDCQKKCSVNEENALEKIYSIELKANSEFIFNTRYEMYLK